MRKIYLATDSKARRKVFELFGLKFKVMPSRIRERKRAEGSSFSQLVKKNAEDKAKEVAKRIKSGIVISADTISVQDGKIYGKPKNLKDARNMLKKLSQKPQWVYTGIAVIDKPPHQFLKTPLRRKRNWCGGKDKQRIFVGSEKTKVIMDKLNDREINAYFREVSPLDKAGSFDIQGRGAFFIRRVEGCFYNVVGLPVNRLYKILKAAGVVSFFCVLCFSLYGCSTEYSVVTGQEETYFYSTDREVAMGNAIAKEVDKEYKLDPDPLEQKRVQDIGKRIVAVCDRKELTYHFAVLDEKEVNAVSLPGGYVYIFKGLIDKVDNDDELAGVVAHEVAHIVARHSIKKLQAQQGYSIMRILVAASPGGGNVGGAADLAFTELMLGYSREDELLADQLGARYLKRAGYDPEGMEKFLRKLQEIHRKEPLRPYSYFKTHPYVPDRVRAVKQELGKQIRFNDYINTEQITHEEGKMR